MGTRTERGRRRFHGNPPIRAGGNIAQVGASRPGRRRQPGSSARRHKYQLATLRYGRQGAASASSSAGLARAGRPKRRVAPLRMPKSPTGRTSGRPSDEIRSMWAVHSPTPRSSVTASMTAASDILAKRSKKVMQFCKKEGMAYQQCYRKKNSNFWYCSYETQYRLRVHKGFSEKFGRCLIKSG